MDSTVSGLNEPMKRRKSWASLMIRRPSLKRRNSEKDVKFGSLTRNKGSKLKRQASVPAVTVQRSHLYQPTLGEELDIVKQDHLVKTHPADNRNRRTLVLKRTESALPWGFTLQSYGVQHKTAMSVEHLTYVDYVELGSPADIAGLRKGDIILSVNGHSMENIDHKHMVEFIKTFGNTLRMVVLFEDCSRKVELHLRYMKLKKLLAAKEFELHSINDKISRIQNPQQADLHSRSATCFLNSDSHSFNGNWDPSQDVQAIATLPRRPKPLLGRMVKSECFDNDSLNNYHSLPRPRTLEVPQRKFHPNISTSQSSSRVSFCVSEDDELSQEGASAPKSESCSAVQTVSSPYINRPELMAPEQYYSLPIRGKNKRPTSLQLPEITITPPTLNRGRSLRDVSSFSLCSNFSESSQSVFSNGNSEIDSNGNISESGKSETPIIMRNSLNRSRSNSRSRSFRASFRQSFSVSSGESYHGSSNHVLTEWNSRLSSDPELIRIKQGNMDLRSPDLPEQKTNLFRSLSAPAMRVMSVLDEKRKKILANRRSNIDNSQNKPKDNLEADNGRMNGKISSGDIHNVNCTCTQCASHDGAQQVPQVHIVQHICGHTCTHCTRTNQNFSTQSCDRNGNFSTAVPALFEQLEQLSLVHELPLHESTPVFLDVPRIKTRPLSTGSDFSVGSRSQRSSSSSMLSDNSNRSSGSFEYYPDPFTPSPDDQKVPDFIPNNYDTPTTSKRSWRPTNYTKHKDLLRTEMRLMNINEEDEITRL